MLDYNSRPQWGVVWLSVGLLWWLLGMSVLPSSKVYHQGLMALSWLPGLVVCFRCEALCRAWRQRLSLTLLALVAWSAASWWWSQTSTPISEMKVFVYVLLATNAFLALAVLNASAFWRCLACGALANGFLALVSVVYFYGWTVSGDWKERAVGIGLLSDPILAAQAYVSTALLLPFLREHLPVRLRGWAFYLSCFGYVAFLLLCQSRGPLLAAVVTVLLLPLWMRTRGAWLAAGTVATAMIILALLLPYLFLQRGLSYRPELFHLAWQQFLLHPFIGIGFDSPYWLKVAGLDPPFKHAHNLYLHIAIILGAFGLGLWLWLQVEAWRIAWRARLESEGRALCTLLCFAELAVFTDASGLWVKPREEWFCIWFPIFLALVLPTVLSTKDRRTT